MGNRIGYDILKDCFHGFGANLSLAQQSIGILCIASDHTVLQTEAGVPMCFYKMVNETSRLKLLSFSKIVFYIRKVIQLLAIKFT